MKSSKIGVSIIPKKLPRTELKIAAVSLPFAALVNITALETGGGIQATVIKLKTALFLEQFIHKLTPLRSNDLQQKSLIVL